MSLAIDNPPVTLGPGLNLKAIAAVYAKFGRVHIPGILERAAAERAYRTLTQETRWRRAINVGEQGYDADVAEWNAMPDEQRRELTAQVVAKGRNGFQYFYETIRLSDLHERGELMDSYLMRVYEFLSSEVFLAFGRAVTGAQTIRRVDAQATCYRIGDFLTAHHDQVEGKHRRAAYILNLTPAWRADWGGLLQFLDGDGHVAEAYTPAFNALNILRVPQMHSVSYVNPLAGAPRFSITGWFRDA
jgi:Rps23 Pro-64 3,4-dihydroxylase Tpa1-like proline 4-hydroxylase